MVNEYISMHQDRVTEGVMSLQLLNLKVIFPEKETPSPVGCTERIPRCGISLLIIMAARLDMVHMVNDIFDN